MRGDLRPPQSARTNPTSSHGAASGRVMLVVPLKPLSATAYALPILDDEHQQLYGIVHRDPESLRGRRQHHSQVPLL